LTSPFRGAGLGPVPRLCMIPARCHDPDALAITACVAAMGTVLLVPPAIVEAAGLPLPAITPAGWLRIAYLGEPWLAVEWSYRMRS
jgi:hypothetical protein